MEKIPTVYVRDPDNPKYVTREVSPGCEWVLAGEGTPTRKIDGTCVMLEPNGLWWARREVKPGKEAPPYFAPISTDENTGKTVGWEPIAYSGFAKWHTLALTTAGDLEPGTYELIGEKVNGNPEGVEGHELVRHGAHPIYLDDPDAGPYPLILMCHAEGWEGVVWHHPDGRMAKLKVRDYPASFFDAALSREQP